MIIVKTATSEIVSRNEMEEDVSKDGKSFKLPVDISQIDLRDFGYIQIPYTQPSDLPDNTYAELSGAEQVNGEWRLTWSIRDIETGVPQSVTMRQARLVLHDGGYLESVDTFMEQADKRIQIEWESTRDVYRDSPLIPILRDHLLLTDENIDQLFMEAAQL